MGLLNLLENRNKNKNKNKDKEEINPIGNVVNKHSILSSKPLPKYSTSFFPSTGNSNSTYRISDVVIPTTPQPLPSYVESGYFVEGYA